MADGRCPSCLSTVTEVAEIDLRPLPARSAQLVQNELGAGGQATAPSPPPVPPVMVSTAQFATGSPTSSPADISPRAESGMAPPVVGADQPPEAQHDARTAKTSAGPESNPPEPAQQPRERGGMGAIGAVVGAVAGFMIADRFSMPGSDNSLFTLKSVAVSAFLGSMIGSLFRTANPDGPTPQETENQQVVHPARPNPPRSPSRPGNNGQRYFNIGLTTGGIIGVGAAVFYLTSGLNPHPGHFLDWETNLILAACPISGALTGLLIGLLVPSRRTEPQRLEPLPDDRARRPAPGESSRIQQPHLEPSALAPRPARSPYVGLAVVAAIMLLLALTFLLGHILSR